MTIKILVAGIGQSLRGDDAAGLEAVRLWQEKYPQSARRVDVEISELPGLALLDMLAGKEAAVLVDAVENLGSPGKLHRLSSEELDSFAAGSGSAHGWGVAETLKLGLSLYPELAACRITLIGIESDTVEMGTALSGNVNAALPEAVQMIEQELRNLL